MLNIKVIPVGPFMQNCRVIWDSNTAEALVIDPGDDGHKIIDFLQNKSLTPIAILLTHGHLDHASATDVVRKKFGCHVYMHPEESVVYNSIKTHATAYGLNLPQPSPHDVDVKDGQTLEFLGQKIKVIFTPGHTPGGVCYHFYENRPQFLLVGDTLFQGSIGRTDLPGGNSKQLLQSIQNKLYKLDHDVVVMSGHGPDTTIGEEKASNPFVRG